MTRCLALDVEVRLDRLALAASGRSSAPRDMPAPLQVLTGAATLSFDRDAAGLSSGFRMDSIEGAEAGIAAFVERELALLHADGGELLTYNGGHDLAVLRFALLRARLLGGGGVSRWLEAESTRHRDLMLDVARGGRSPRLADAAAGLGFAPATLHRTVGEAGGASVKAETDVAMTALLAIHLDVERNGDTSTLARSLLGFGRFLGRRALTNPHIQDLLGSRLFGSSSKNLVKAGR